MPAAVRMLAPERSAATTSPTKKFDSPTKSAT
jgi:hypothetical protein